MSKGCLPALSVFDKIGKHVRFPHLTSGAETGHALLAGVLVLAMSAACAAPEAPLHTTPEPLPTPRIVLWPTDVNVQPPGMRAPGLRAVRRLRVGLGRRQGQAGLRGRGRKGQRSRCGLRLPAMRPGAPRPGRLQVSRP